MTTLESPDQLAAALDALAESPKLDRHEALAAKQAASVIREQHLALEAACQMEHASADAAGWPDNVLDGVSEAILRACGSTLRHYEPTTRARVREVTRVSIRWALLPKLNEALK